MQVQHPNKAASNFIIYDFIYNVLLLFLRVSKAQLIMKLIEFDGVLSLTCEAFIQQEHLLINT